MKKTNAAVLMIIVGLIAVAAGGLWFQSSKPSSADKAVAAFAALDCAQTGESCGGTSDDGDPARLALAAAGVVLLLGGVVVAVWPATASR